MCFNEVTGNGETNARAAACVARAGFVHAVEAGEEIFQMFGRNANAGVFDGDNDFIIFLNCRDGHAAVFGSVLQGVRCEVGEDLRDAVFVS